MRYKNITVAMKAPVTTITLNRPEQTNALSIALSDELREAVRLIKERKDIAVVVFRGAGGNFCAGDDIKEFDNWGDIIDVVDRVKLYQHTSNEIEDMDPITIAAVEGFAVGGGLEITMACDFVVATEGSRFGIPEVDIGITPGWGGTQRLGRYVGRRKVKEMIYLGTLIDADEALRYNLVTKVVPKGKLDEAVNDLIRVLLSKDHKVLKMAKRIINRGLECDLRTALDFEVMSTSITWQTDAKRNGCHSFGDKREPWTKARQIVDEYQKKKFR